MLTLCDSFIRQSRATWGLIRKSTSINFSIGEETITDLNLLRLRDKHPKEILTVKCNKYLEGMIGSDWEWFLIASGKIIAFRIQAKIIDVNTLSYPELGYKQRTGTRQIDLLIDSSRKAAHAPVPLYIFYNYWKRGIFNPVWRCGSYKKSSTMLGCGVAYAETVRQILNAGSNQLEDLTNIMFPWSCIICCTMGKQQRVDLVTQALSFTKEILASGSPQEIPNGPFSWNAIPQYVIKILERERMSEDDWLEAGVKRITIIRQI